MLKALFILVLSVAIFGSAAYWGYELFLRPQVELTDEKRMPAPPPPPDPSLAEFARCLETEKQKGPLDARNAYARFLEENPRSTKLEEAKEHLGNINSRLFLSPVRTPEKEEYIVKSGDTVTRITAKMKTTPELLLAANQLNSIKLRIGQRLLVSPGEFSLVINKKTQTVTLLNHGKFFKQYPIKDLPQHPAVASKKAATPPPAKVSGKVVEKIAWAPAGQRVTIADKEYPEASHWIALSVAGQTLYSDPDPQSELKAPKPPAGLGLAPEHMTELAALLRKGDPVTIER